MSANDPRPLETGREYFWRRTPGWTWIDGSTRWWEVFVKVMGLNGIGGYWAAVIWRWNGSSEDNRLTVLSMTYEDSRKLDAEVAEAKRWDGKLPGED